MSDPLRVTMGPEPKSLLSITFPTDEGNMTFILDEPLLVPAGRTVFVNVDTEKWICTVYLYDSGGRKTERRGSLDKGGAA
ncbi:MAG: hypothetical protein HUU06_05365 [Planctomycetaceae bacterium]|nr:hypothetical protein [Planctomycetaceae bacterium]